jgi:hypothetical protein
MGFRFEFDPGNKVLMVRVEGRLTDQLLAEVLLAIRKYSTETAPRAGIVNFSAVTEVATSSGFIRELARQEPVMLDASRPRVIVAPGEVMFGLSRMFQLAGERTRPLLDVVRTLDEALALLGVESPQFEPLA